MPAQISIVVSETRVGGGAIQSTTADLDTLGKAADSSGGRVSGFFSNMMSSAAGFLAANVIGKIASSFSDFISGGLEDARGAAMLMASTQQTIETMGNAAGRSAEEVAAMASALSDAAGKSLFGDDQIQQSANLLLTFGNIKGAVFDTATALTVDLAAALGGAPADSAMMLGKALNDPIHGMTALGKAGLTFSEEQKAAIKAMQESGDMAGAQAIIIEELTKQVGGQAAAQAAAAGGWVVFQARMGEAAETLGTALLPVLNAFADFMVANVMPLIEDAIGAFSTFATGAIPALTRAWSMLQPGMETVIRLAGQIITAFSSGNFAPILTTLQGLGERAGRWLLDALPGFLSSVATYREQLFSGITAALPRVLAALAPLAAAAGRWILDALPGMLSNLGAFFQAIVNQTMTHVPRWVGVLGQFGVAAISWIAAAMPGLMNSLGQFLNSMLNWVVSSIPRWSSELLKLAQQLGAFVLAALPDLGTNLGKALGVLLAWIVQTAADVVPKLAVLAVKFVAWVYTDVIPALPGALMKIGEFFNNFLNSLAAAVVPLLAKVAEKFYLWVVTDVLPALPGEVAKIQTAIGNWLAGAVTWAVGELAKLGTAMVDGIKAGITAGWSSLTSYVQQKLAETLQAAKNAIFAESPSRLYAEQIGLPIAQGIAVGIGEGAPEIDKTLADTLNESAVTAETGAGVIGAAVPPAMGRGYSSRVGEFANTVKSGLSETLSKAMDAAWNLGEGLMEGLADGLSDNADMVFETMDGVAQGAIEQAEETTGTESPSKVFMEIGRALIEGLVEGISQLAPTVDKKLLETFGAALAAIMNAMGNAIGAIADLQGFAGISLSTVKLFVATINGIMAEFSQAARDWLPHRTEIVERFTDMGKGVFDAVLSGLEAFEKMAKVAVISEVHVHIFAGNMTAIFDFLVARMDDWSEAALGTSAGYLDLVGQLLSAIAEGADAFTALEGIVAIQESSVTIFVNGVFLVVQKLMAIVGQFEADGVVAAATFAESAGDIISIIGQGAEGFNALQDFTGVSSAAIALFVAAIQQTTAAFVTMAGDFEAEAVEAAAVFAEGAGKVVSIISGGVDGFLKLVDFKGVPVAAIQDFALAVSASVVLLSVFAVGTISQEAVAAAAVFSEGAGKVVGIISSGVEGFLKLAEFKAIPTAAIQDFALSVSAAVVLLSVFAVGTISQEAVAAAAVFAEGVGKIISIISDGVEAFAKLGEFQSVSVSVIQSFATGLAALLTEMQTRALPAATNLGAQIIQGIVQGFQSQIPGMINALVAAVQQAIQAVRTTLGIASPSMLAAERIGLPIAQGIAQGVGAGAPQIAGAIGAATTINNYSISYGSNVPSSGSAASDIRMLTMLGAGAF